MPTHDINAREYAKLSTVKVGDKLQVDGGFTCMKDGEIKTVYADDKDEVYVHCDGEGAADGEIGRHYLDGQLDDENGDSLIGLYPVE